MSKVIHRIYRTIRKIAFPILILIIIIVFFYNQEVAIWITGITIIIYLISYIPPIIIKYRFLRFMKGYYMIEDDTIAKQKGKLLRKVQLRMFNLSQEQHWDKRFYDYPKKPNWLIIFHEKHYIFYHGQTIEKYLDLYSKGYNESKLLENLKDHDLRTRAEIKAIRETLKKNNRLIKRKISVQERKDAERFA
ncbi:MAG: hypothetical protein ACTSR8_09130 [Promethearchaeota archaeon]